MDTADIYRRWENAVAAEEAKLPEGPTRREQALKNCVRQNPELHQEYLAAYNREHNSRRA